MAEGLAGAGEIKFGNSAPLGRHVASKKTNKERYQTPSPAAYNVGTFERVKYNAPRRTAFGGNLCKMDREKGSVREDAARRKNLPGPDAYAGAAESKLNNRPRSPAVRFGSSEREALSRQYISKRDTLGHDPNKGNHSNPATPGPGTYPVVDTSNTKKRSPAYSMRPRLPVRELKPATSGPKVGPASYQRPSSMGSQPLSGRPSSARTKIGCATRDKESVVCSPGYQPRSKFRTPSPGTYNVSESFGKQAVSKSRTSAAYSFGASETKPRERPKSSPHTTRRPPGPGSYGWTSSMGLQAETRHRSSGGFKFGTSQRPECNEGLVG